MGFNFMLPLRIAQATLAIIDLGLVAFVASWYNSSTSVASPSQVNFLIFVSLWTAVIVVPYLTLTPRFFPAAAHKFGILAAEVLTMLFWFAGFIALAAFLGRLVFCKGNVCNSARAAVAFGAFEWVLFTATTVMASIHVLRTRGQSGVSDKQQMGQMNHNGL